MTENVCMLQCACLSVGVCVCVYVCACAFVYVRVCAYMCMCTSLNSSLPHSYSHTLVHSMHNV